MYCFTLLALFLEVKRAILKVVDIEFGDKQEVNDMSEHNVIGYALMRGDGRYSYQLSDGTWIYSKMFTPLSLSEALRHKEGDDTIVKILNGGEVDTITCKVEDGIVSWWRLGEDEPVLARSVAELRHMFIVAREDGVYFCADANSGLVQCERDEIGAYDVMTGKAVES